MSRRKGRRRGKKHNRQNDNAPRLDISAAHEMGLTENSGIHEDDDDFRGCENPTVGIDTVGDDYKEAWRDEKSADPAETMDMAAAEEERDESYGDTYGHYGETGDTFGGDMASGEAAIAEENLRMMDDDIETTAAPRDFGTFDERPPSEDAPAYDDDQPLFAGSAEDQPLFDDGRRAESQLPEELRAPSEDLYEPSEEDTNIGEAATELMSSEALETSDSALETRPVTGSMVESTEDIKPWKLPEIPRHPSPPAAMAGELPEEPPGTFSKTVDWDDREADSGRFELGAGDMVVERATPKDETPVPLWQQPMVRRAGEIAAAALAGLIIGWVAWGGGEAPVAAAPEETAAVEEVAKVVEPTDDAPAAVADADQQVDEEAPTDAVAADAPAALDEPEESDQHQLAAADRVDAEDVDAPLPEPTPEAKTVAAKDCNVVIQTTPRGAGIWLGKKRVGKTPFSGTMPCGDQAVRLTAKGRKAKTLSVSLGSDSINRISTKLASALPMVQLRITSKPNRAVVRVNGKRVGMTPVTTKVPKRKKARIVVTKKGHKTAKRTIVPKKKTRVKVALKRAKQKKRKNRRKRRRFSKRDRR